MTKPTRSDVAGQRYLDLQKLARERGQRTDELFQLYALEGFLDRLLTSRFAAQFVLKGGVLLAALDARRPTRDIDFLAQDIDNDIELMKRTVVEIAGRELDDGIAFDTSTAAAHTIRDGDDYSGVRIEMQATLSRARLSFHVDINVGDPVSPPPNEVELPRLLGGVLHVRGYPIEMVLAEKLVTALERGTANTRWRDFLDVYSLINSHGIEGNVIGRSVEIVAAHRSAVLSSFRERLDRFPAIGQQRWAAWLRKNSIAGIPNLEDVIVRISDFAEPVLNSEVAECYWQPATGMWTPKETT